MNDVTFEQVDGVPVARPRGDIDSSNASRIRDQLAGCIGPNVEHLVVDLTDTRYLDSAGVDMLFRLSERLRQSRAKLLLVVPPSSQLNRLIEIVALDEAVPVHETVEQALGACLHDGG